ncbi:MAG: amino acid ABC transporter ATP-binding protein, partial [Oscillospiraceae bacterium]|nr:amino acid ABC transporter ATP-binding protein [Oscillospiraceae bacterium]
ELICSYCEETGCTVLLITHSIQQARRIAKHMIFLDEGRLIEQGETERLLTSPAKDATRRFLEFYGI